MGKQTRSKKSVSAIGKGKFGFPKRSTGSGGSKVNEQGEVVMFSDVAGIDKAKEEFEEIVGRLIFLMGSPCTDLMRIYVEEEEAVSGQVEAFNGSSAYHLSQG
ncbi:hypothetical protein L1887_00383 [Cichorium endivia]|nr:hypothetical protein L1887_00383 [Cichorium endivia]